MRSVGGRGGGLAGAPMALRTWVRFVRWFGVRMVSGAAVLWRECVEVGVSGKDEASDSVD